ncbi:MAG: hypothetical protein Q4G62_01570 [Pseudomonadota bacterium]|nr:hypothetical protein [Pseudomonadota bacterium]
MTIIFIIGVVVFLLAGLFSVMHSVIRPMVDYLYPPPTPHEEVSAQAIQPASVVVHPVAGRSVHMASASSSKARRNADATKEWWRKVERKHAIRQAMQKHTPGPRRLP